MSRLLPLLVLLNITSVPRSFSETGGFDIPADFAAKGYYLVPENEKKAFAESLLPFTLAKEGDKRSQLVCSSGNYTHNYAAELNSGGKGNGWYFRAAFTTDANGNNNYDYICQAATGFYGQSPFPSVVCVGALIHTGRDPKREDFISGSSFAIGPCEDPARKGELCQIQVKAPDNQVFEKMYRTGAIDFSALEPGEEIGASKCKVYGNQEIFSGKEGTVLALTPRPKEKSDLPAFHAWEQVSMRKLGKFASNIEVIELLMNLKNTCGWIGFRAGEDTERPGKLFIAFGETGLQGRYPKVHSSLQPYRGVVVYDRNKKEFTILYHAEPKLQGQTFDYRTFVCEQMCYRDNLDEGSTRLNPLGCKRFGWERD